MAKRTAGIMKLADPPKTIRWKICILSLLADQYDPIFVHAHDWVIEGENAIFYKYFNGDKKKVAAVKQWQLIIEEEKVDSEKIHLIKEEFSKSS